MKRNPRSPRLSPLSSAIALATGATLLLQGSYVQAQEPEPDAQLEEITVTGTRIQRTSGFTTPVPVTAVSLEEIQSFKPGTTMADQLDQLPQFYQTQSAQRGGGALFGSAGGSYLDLRAMGPARTLILLDGARVTPADRNGTVNVDNFPTALLRSVEVVTGGASAAYGADALAGVTNFILNRDFRGVDMSFDVGTTDAGDGDNVAFSVAGGLDIGERWSFIGSFENQTIDQIQRSPDEAGDWYRRWGFVQNPAWSAASPAAVPRNLKLPDVHSTVHAPTGKIDKFLSGGTVVVPTFTFNGQSPVGQVFTMDGTGLVSFAVGDVVGCGATPACITSAPPPPLGQPVSATGTGSGGTGSQSGGAGAALANDAFGGGPYGAEVRRNNVFAGFTFDPTEDTRLFSNLIYGTTESNNLNDRGIPHGTSPWHYQIFRENAYLPQALRDAMIAQNLTSFTLQKQGTVLGMPGNYNDHEERRNEFETWMLQLGLDHQLNDNWRMQARVQRGSTQKYTAVLNELRVDREYLGMDAVEVYNDRRNLDGDTAADLVSEADRGTGTIICNVQRYPVTDALLQQSVAGFRVPSVQGDDSLGGPDELVPIPGPVGPDAISNCVPFNVLGQGNVSQAAQDYLTSMKWGDSVVTQEFAEVLFTGDIWDGFGPGAFSIATGLTYRDQTFWQRGQPQALMAYGPPRNADGSAAANGVNLGIRGIPAGFTGGSANLHEFSTVPVIKGGFDVNELFAEINMPLWDSGPRRLEVDVAGRRSDYSTSGAIDSYKVGVNLQIAEFLRFRATNSRDVREPTFSERFDLQGGGGRVNDPLNGNASVEITTVTGGNPNLAPEEADTNTAGFVFQPAKVPGFQFSVDWYEIDLSEAVGQLGAQLIVNECAAGVPNRCEYVMRDPLTNAITSVRNVYLNIDRAMVRGIDYELLFNAEPNLASNQSEALTFRLLAGRLLEDSTTSRTATGGFATTDNSNLYTEPDLEVLASVRYQIGAFGIGLQQRYLPESRLNVNWLEWQPGIVLPTPTTITVDDNTVEGQTNTDLTFTYDASERGENARWALSLAISNVFDVDPPVVADFGQRFSAQTIPVNSFDVYGRRFLMSVDYRF
jgi:outer membrane receptor protein involved in Fe transport